MELGEFIIMPNHIHGIMIIRDNIVGAMRRIAYHPQRPRPYPKKHRPYHPQRRGPGFDWRDPQPNQIKHCQTYKHLARRSRYSRMAAQLFEHIIRSDAEMARIFAYIRANPANWEIDRENPEYF